jgi:curved DNA-binding protein
MDYVDYYKLLGIEKSATQKDVKSAYRKLARKYHPDLNPNDKDAKRKFQQINEANEVLSDPEKRKKYDQYGKDWQHSDQFEQQNQYRQQNTGQKKYSQTQSGEDFSDFFESLFGGGASGFGKTRQAKFRGEDFNAELQLDLEDAFTTHKRTLNVNGAKIRITIPAGIENGQTIKIPGHGGKGINGGPDGDLYITFSITDHARFKRLGNDLYATVDLDLFKAVLGGEITIDTLNGKVKLKVKPETQTGSKVKLKNKGFPAYKKEGLYGDLFITYNIKIPTNLTEKQLELFRQLSQS